MKYELRFERPQYEMALVEIEADSLEEAKEKALEVSIGIGEWESCEYYDDHKRELISITGEDGSQLWDAELGVIIEEVSDGA